MSALGPFAWAKTRERAFGPEGSSCERGSRRHEKRNRRHDRTARRGRWDRERARRNGIPPRKYLDVLLLLERQSIECEEQQDVRDRRVRWLSAAGYVTIGDERWWLLNDKAIKALEAYRAIPFYGLTLRMA